MATDTEVISLGATGKEARMRPIAPLLFKERASVPYDVVRQLTVRSLGRRSCRPIAATLWILLGPSGPVSAPS